MKRTALVPLLLLASIASAQTAADKIAAGRTALAAHDVSTARTRFSEALGLEPANQTAAALFGYMRVANIAGQTASTSFLNALAVAPTGRDVYRWDAPLPRNANGHTVLPTNYNLTTAASFWQSTIIPETTAARANLALVTNTGFLLTLYPSETRLPMSLTIDYGDVLLSRASLSALEFVLHFLSGQNLDANLDALNRLHQDGLLTLPRLVADNPNFFTIGSTSERVAAKTSLLEVIQLYRQASTFIRTVRPVGARRMFMLTPDELAAEADFRAKLDQLERSLTEPVAFGHQGIRYATTGPLFGPTWSARARLPVFSSTGFDYLSITDPTLGGLVIGMSREEVARFFHNAEVGWSWVSPVPRGNALNRHLALANGKRIAVGDAGTVYTSDDGTTWTLRSIAGGGRLSGLAEGTGTLAGKVVAVGAEKIFLSSDYGVTWQLVATGWGQLRAVTFGGGKFVAVGDYGAGAVSTDGQQWTFGSGVYAILNDVIYTGSFFLAVGQDPSQNRAAIYTSTDGVNWTNRYTATTTGFQYTSVAQGASMFMVVGWSNNSVFSANLTAATSWTPSTVLSSGTPSFNGVVYRSSASSFVTVGSGGAAAVISETALIATPTLGWTSVSSGETVPLTAIGNAGDGVYATGFAGVLTRSTNIASATPTFARVVDPTAPTALTSTYLAVRAIDGQLYVAVSDGSILRSSNGTAFTVASTSGNTNQLWTLLKQGSTFYAAGNAGTILTSADGATWAAIISGNAGANTTANLRSMRYLNGQFVATGSNGTILTSPTGATNTWTSRASGSSHTIYDVAFGMIGEVPTLVAVGGNGASGQGGANSVLTSFDNGATWAPVTVSTPSTFRAVVFHQGYFTAVGLDGAIFRSTNGTNWSFVNSRSATHLVGLRVLDGRYYALESTQGSYGFSPQCAVLVSSDGLNWLRILQGAAGFQYGVELANVDGARRLYTVGANASILRSAALPAPAVPVIAALTTGRQARQGDNLVLAAAGNGDGGETYVWAKGGTAIPGATGPALQLTNIQPTDAGSYTVTVTNIAGPAVSAPIVLTVDTTPVAPYITQQPVSRTVNVGLAARFAVVANGTAPFTYQWRKDGGNIAGATSATLDLTNVQYTDAGSYTVVVTGVSPAVTSDPAVLTIDSNPAYTFSTLAGLAGQAGADNGSGSAARFRNPGAVAADNAGNLYVADGGNHTIRKIVIATGAVTTLAGSAGVSGSADGTTAARFNMPKGVVFDSVSGSLFVADFGNSAIRKINLSTLNVTTLAANVGQPNFLAVDASGNVYFTTTAHIVRKTTADGATTTTIAGTSGTAGMINGIGSNARFNNPQGIALDSSGNLLVADNGNMVVRKIASDTTVTTLAGVPASFGTEDGPAGVGLLYYPMGLAVDAAGYVYVSEDYTARVRKISPAGTIRTIGGQTYSYGAVDGVGVDARFAGPSGLALDASGVLYVADTYNMTVRKGVPSASLLAPAIGVPPRDMIATLGGSVQFTVGATGVAPLVFQWRKNGVDIPAANTATLSLSSLTAGEAGVYSVRVTNAHGTAVSPGATLTVVAAVPPPTISSFAPTSAAGGRSVVITGVGYVDVTGVAIGGLSALFTVDSATQITAIVPMLAASGNIAITTGAGTATSTTALTIPNARVLVNQSTRITLTTGVPDVVASFSVQGTTPKSVLLRAVGPGLVSLGIDGALTDPILTLHDHTGLQIGANDDWGGGSALSTAFSNVGAMPLTATSRDSALLVTLNPGTYSARVSGVGGLLGVVLLEVYDADTSPRLGYLATRGIVGTGSSILTSGFVVGGTSSQMVLVRALGPTTGLPGVLANPTLSVFTGSGTLIATNDNWSAAPELASATMAVGAMPLPANGTESALLLTLAPGAYTAQVAGVGSTSGVAQVEVFQVDAYVLGSRPATLVPARTIGLNQGAAFVLAAPFVAKPNVVAFQWRKNAVDLQGATNLAFAIASVQTSDAGSYSVAMTNAQGTTTSADYVLVVGNGPTISVMPATSQSVTVGGTLSFGVTATGNPTPTFQWQRNGANIEGATNSSITIANAQQAQAGSYRVVVTNTVASITSNPITVAVIERSVLNVLSRLTVPARGSISSSFTVEGGSKNILIRAAGPALNVTGQLADPRITLLSASWATISINDDWGTNANATAITTTTAALGLSPGFAAGSRDAALLMTLAAGTYTAVVDGVGSTGGLAQLEVVDADTGLWPRLAMMTMRGPVSWTVHMIVGFNIGGTAEQKYLMRVLGPTLGHNMAGNNGVLNDPYLYLYRGTTELARDDDSYADTAVDAATALVGAMPRIGRNNYTTGWDNYDSTLFMNLTPGSYTADVRPYWSGISGDAMFEIFPVDEQRPATMPPAITYVSAHQQGIAGADAAFAVVVVAKPAATFQWRRYSNGVPTPINGATASTYRLPNLTPADSGSSFDVVITSGGTTLTSPQRTLTILSDFHSADTNRDRRISVPEITRVMQLYNSLNGATRTGEYHTQTGTEDGYAPGPGAITVYHSADSNRDGRIDTTELSRVIALFSYASGTVRTGEYHSQLGTEDGFAPGPASGGED